MKYDIEITGQGFYVISGNTKRGRNWMIKNVQGTSSWDASAPCDDMGYTQDIADGAVEQGLRVRVNGRNYLGNNRVAA
jgi:hypothetical protein